MTPAQIPTERLLDDLNAGRGLGDQQFTTVGYGQRRETASGGPHGILPVDGTRRVATQSYLALEPAWLQLSMQVATGDGGTAERDVSTGGRRTTKRRPSATRALAV